MSANNLELKKNLKETDALRTIISTKNTETERLKYPLLLLLLKQN